MCVFDVCASLHEYIFVPRKRNVLHPLFSPRLRCTSPSLNRVSVQALLALCINIDVSKPCMLILFILCQAMRLLDTEAGQFVDFPDVTRLPPYAILSHTWNSEGEQTYQDIKEIQHAHARKAQLLPVAIVPTHRPRRVESSRSSSGAQPVSVHIGPANGKSFVSFWDDPTISPKVRMACAVARADGYRYIWIDSCCIDKTSSAELSEAINSMYRWYGKAAICYAFLADVPHDDRPHATTSKFRRSRWFTRGWTLQELIAPRNLLFMSREWSVMGSKQELSPLLEEITGIDVEVLKQQKRLDEVSVARRMSWASRRETTRVEDQAYSLFGIFDVNMPTLYGEGSRAFMRLQQEILQQIPDQSLFAWGGTYPHPLPLGPDPGVPENHDYAHRRPHFYSLLQSSSSSLFASSPSSFLNSGSIHSIPDDILLRRLRDLDVPVLEYTPSPYGMRTQLLLLDVAPSSLSTDGQSSVILPRFHGATEVRRWYLAVLACEHAHRRGEVLSRICFTESSNANLQLLRSGFVYPKVVGSLQQRLKWGDRPISDFDVLVSVSPSQIEACRPNLASKTVYIPYHKGDESSDPSFEHASLLGRYSGWTLELSETDRTILKYREYHVHQWTPDEPNRHCVTLAKQSHEAIELNLEYRRAGGEELHLRVEVRVGRQRQATLGWECWRSTEALFAFQELELAISKSSSPEDEDKREDKDGDGGRDAKDEAARQEVLVHLQIRLERSVEADRHQLRLEVDEPETWIRGGEWSPGSPSSRDSNAPSLSQLIYPADRDDFRVGAYRQPAVCSLTEDEFWDAIAAENNFRGGPRRRMEQRPYRRATDGRYTWR